jgi:hypothetical protein
MAAQKVTERDLMRRVRPIAPFIRWSYRLAVLPCPWWCPSWVMLGPARLSAFLVKLAATW